jgi:hypothetical protein
MMPLTPTLFLASWSWRSMAHHAGWSLVPLIRLLPRDARLMAANVQALVWARYVVVRWHELNAMPLIVQLPND